MPSATPSAYVLVTPYAIRMLESPTPEDQEHMHTFADLLCRDDPMQAGELDDALRTLFEDEVIDDEEMDALYSFAMFRDWKTVESGVQLPAGTCLYVCNVRF